MTKKVKKQVELLHLNFQILLSNKKKITKLRL